ENVGEWLVFLRVLQQRVGEERLTGPGGAKNQSVRYIAIVKIQEIGRRVIGLKDRKIFAVKVIVPFFSGQNCEKERKIGVVGVKQKKPAKTVSVIARHSREIGVELVVAF